MNIPDQLVWPLQYFAKSYASRCEEGRVQLTNSAVAFVGLARNCGVRLAENLGRLEQLTSAAKSWQLHIETNDNTDQTVQVLADYCREHRQATFADQTLGRQQFSTEFAGPRTIALAEYRDACQRWVRECAVDADYVIVIDWDQWGGWSTPGVLNGLGWLAQMPDAYCVASVSLIQMPVMAIDSNGSVGQCAAWMHYDAWALRLNSYWDDYTAGFGGWKHHWLPPIGSDPVRVCSAFGGLSIYRTDAYLSGTYDGVHDCEHVSFHASIAKATGRHMYLNPSQRCIMHWMEPCEETPQPSV
jgi:hypothetical protein